MGSVEEFNALPTARAEADLIACCAAPRWAYLIAAGRPYPDLPALLAAADAASRALTWPDVALALAAHPRIGQRAAGPSTGAAWSRQEQAAVGTAADEVRAALAEGNRAYEERFGHVFLIRADGRSAEEMLAALRERLGNDPGAERRAVAEELRQITRLRLERLLRP